MKKILFAFAAVALLFATSCKKESVNDPVTPADPTSIPENSFLCEIETGAKTQNTPRVEDGMGTLAHFNGSDVKWQQGDVINVNGTEFTCNSNTATGNRAYFEGNGGQPFQRESYKAVYPASWVSGTESSPVYEMPHQIEYNTARTAAQLPMYAESDNHWLSFKNICAAAKLTVPVACAKIIVITDQNISGSFTIKDASTNAPYAEIATSGTVYKYIEIVNNTQENGESATGFAQNDIVYFAIPKGTYSNFTVEFYDADGTFLGRKVSSSNITLAVNNLYTFTVSTQLEKCLCFTAVEDGAKVKFTIKNVTTTIQYRDKNHTAWTTYNSGTQINLNNGERVYFRAAADHNTAYYNSNSNRSQFSIEGGKVEASGNIMSLYGPNCPKISLPNEAFRELFSDCSKLVKAPELPATTLAWCCYYGMFKNCTSLMSAPALPATTMAGSCYAYMFEGCTDLTNVPELNAVTLDNYCFEWMFHNCTKLTSVPALRATNLCYHCYNFMFYNCSQLSSVTMNATGGNIDESLTGWLYDAGPQSGARVNIDHSITSLANGSGAGYYICKWTSSRWGIYSNGNYLGNGNTSN